MKIRYENTLEHAVAFNRYHCNHSPSMRRSKAIATGSLPAILVLLALPNVIQGHVTDIIYVAIISGVWVLIFPVFHRWLTDRRVRRLCREGPSKGLFGTRELELTETELVERSPHGELRTQFAAVEKIATDDKSTFIYTNALGAHVISRDAVLEGDYDSFVQAVKQRLAERSKDA